jgi:AcrR family transcriptional regulator
MPRAVRERQMMDAAVRIFGRYGYRAASMDGIAEEAGVSKPLVYLYLKSKEELFTACIRREAGALMAALRSAADPGLAPEGQLRAGLTAFFEHTTRHPDSWIVLHRQAHAHGDPFAAEAHEVRAQLVAYVTDLIGAAAREARSAAALDHGTAPAAPVEGRTPAARVEGRSAAAPDEGRAPDRAPASDAPDAARLRSDSPNSFNSPLSSPSSPPPVSPRHTDFTERDLGALAHALVGAAEELARWTNETAGATAREATSALMNFAWTGLGGLLAGARWTPSDGAQASEPSPASQAPGGTHRAEEARSSHRGHDCSLGAVGSADGER